MTATEPMSHEAKVVLYVLGLAFELAEQGLMVGPDEPLTQIGTAAYDALKASGFRPTTTEIQEVYHHSGLFKNHQVQAVDDYDRPVFREIA